MVLIKKGKGEYRGIGFVETIWKVCTSIFNIQLKVSLYYMKSYTASDRGGKQGQ